jgi:hypothetical protein
VCSSDLDPHSKLRGELIPAAQTKVSEAAKIVAHEVMDKDSKLRSELIPVAQAKVNEAAHAIQHEVMDRDSKLRHEILPAASQTLANGIETAASAVSKAVSK